MLVKDQFFKEVQRKNNALPLCLEQGYFRSYFPVSHLSIHVHVRHGGGDAVFVVDDSIELRKSQNMKVKELRKAQELARENQNLIVEKWHELIT